MRSLAFALTVLATLGCDRLLDIKDLPRHVEVVDSGIVPLFQSSTCETCERATCSAQVDACLANDGCKELVRCVFGKCGADDPKCRLQCERDFASGGISSGKLWRDLDTCTRTNDTCTERCYGFGGLVGGIDKACACTDKSDKPGVTPPCRAEAIACVKSAVDCERRVACIGLAPNPDGFVECVGKYPAGGTEASRLLDCAKKNASCDASCSIAGGVTACANDFTYGTTGDDTVKFSMGVEDAVGSGVVDAKVDACGLPDCMACAFAAGSGVTKAKADEGVRADLDVKMTLGMANAFNGCFRVTPPAGGTGTMRTAVFPGRSIHYNESLLSTVLLDESVVGFYAARLKSDYDPTRGSIIGVVQDCIWGRVLGATVTLEPLPPTPKLDDKVLFAYLRGTEVDETATSTVARAGFAFVNVPPGNYAVVAKKGDTEIVYSKIEVFANTLTDATVYPKYKGARPATP